MNRLPGSHIPPPETAVVPPITAARSRTVTRAPARAAARAAARPAPPDPTTTRSVAMACSLRGPVVRAGGTEQSYRAVVAGGAGRLGARARTALASGYQLNH